LFEYNDELRTNRNIEECQLLNLNKKKRCDFVNFLYTFLINHCFLLEKV